MSGIWAAFFRSILGWMKSVTKWVWSAFVNHTTGSMEWLNKHWLACAVILCVAGLAADWIVNFARWRPDKVYSSFFHRIFHIRSMETEESRFRDETKVKRISKQKKAGGAWNAIRNSMGTTEDEEDLSYHPQPTGISSDESYNSPYVPSQWAKPVTKSGRGRNYRENDK